MTKMESAMTSTIVLDSTTLAAPAMATARAVSDAPTTVPRIITPTRGSTMAVVTSRVAAILLQRIIGFVILKSHVLTMGVVGIGPKAAPICRLAIGTPMPWWRMVRATTPVANQDVRRLTPAISTRWPLKTTGLVNTLLVQAVWIRPHAILMSLPHKTTNHANTSRA